MALFFLRRIYKAYNGGDAIMKAKSIITGTLFGIIGAVAVDIAYGMGQVKGMRDARGILEDCLEKAKCEEEKNKHD